MPDGNARRHVTAKYGYQPLYGKVMDVANSRPIEGASVQLIQNKYDSVTRGKRCGDSAETLNKKGEFSLEKIPVMGGYQLKISAVGFKNHTRKLSLTSTCRPRETETSAVYSTGLIKTWAISNWTSMNNNCKIDAHRFQINHTVKPRQKGIQR